MTDIPCVECRSENVLQSAMNVTVHGVEAVQSGHRCSDCGAWWCRADECAETDLFIAVKLSEREPNPEAFRFMRHAIGLSGKECAAMLGVQPETVSRWEHSARRANPLAWKVLVAKVREKARRP